MGYSYNKSKIDKNHKEIVSSLQNFGAYVLDCSSLREAFDILVFYKSQIYPMEIKDGQLPPSAKKLTPGELKCKAGIEAHTKLRKLHDKLDDLFDDARDEGRGTQSMYEDLNKIKSMQEEVVEKCLGLKRD